MNGFLDREKQKNQIDAMYFTEGTSRANTMRTNNLNQTTGKAKTEAFS